MKNLLIILTLLSLTVTANAWPWNNKKPKENQTIVNVAKPTPTPAKKATISDGRELVREIAAELKSAKEENTRLKSSLEKANTQLQKAESRTIEVQQQADNLKEWGILQQNEAHKFLKKYNDAVKRYHRLKAIAAMIAAAAGVFLGLQFMALVPPPYNLGLPIGAAVLFSLMVWFIL